jgi:hypothetical protein
MRSYLVYLTLNIIFGVVLYKEGEPQMRLRCMCSTSSVDTLIGTQPKESPSLAVFKKGGGCGPPITPSVLYRSVTVKVKV